MVVQAVARCQYFPSSFAVGAKVPKFKTWVTNHRISWSYGVL